MTPALPNNPLIISLKKYYELASQRWMNRLAKAMANGTMPKGYFSAVYDAAPRERIDIIQIGIDAELIPILAKALNIRREQLIDDLGFGRSSIARKVRNKEKLSTDQSERVVGVMKLIGLVEKTVAESGEAKGFDAAQWVGRWMQQPNRGLGGRRPADLMGIVEGQEMVSNLLLSAQAGVCV